MAKLKKFDNENAYRAYVVSDEFEVPDVSAIGAGEVPEFWDAEYNPVYMDKANTTKLVVNSKTLIPPTATKIPFIIDTIVNGKVNAWWRPSTGGTATKINNIDLNFLSGYTQNKVDNLIINTVPVSSSYNNVYIVSAISSDNLSYSYDITVQYGTITLNGETFDSTGGSKTVQLIVGNGNKWKITDIPSWLSFSQTTGEGPTLLTVTAEVYTSPTDDRMANVTVSYIDMEYSAVSQTFIQKKQEGETYITAKNVKLSGVQRSGSVSYTYPMYWHKIDTNMSAEQLKTLTVSASTKHVGELDGSNEGWIVPQFDYLTVNCGTTSTDITADDCYIPLQFNDTGSVYGNTGNTQTIYIMSGDTVISSFEATYIRRYVSGIVNFVLAEDMHNNTNIINLVAESGDTAATAEIVYNKNIDDFIDNGLMTNTGIITNASGWTIYEPTTSSDEFPNRLTVFFPSATTEYDETGTCVYTNTSSGSVNLIVNVIRKGLDIPYFHWYDGSTAITTNINNRQNSVFSGYTVHDIESFTLSSDTQLDMLYTANSNVYATIPANTDAGPRTINIDVNAEWTVNDYTPGLNLSSIRKLNTLNNNDIEDEKLNILNNNITLGASPSNTDYSLQYLTFIAKENGTFKFSGSTTANTIQYSLDNGTTWVALPHNTNTPTVQSGNTIMLKGILRNSYGIGNFISSGLFDVEGNVMSLLYNDDFSGQTTLSSAYTFYNLFSDCTGLISAENLVLPATTLANNCYARMFNGCTSLTSAPELPATNLANYCYNGMFWGCTSLTSAPELPATTLAVGCYNFMFFGCSSLTSAPSILPATSLTESCYESMFSGCTSLTTAPELPATTLVFKCYGGMFEGCTSLSVITCLATDISAYKCTNNWLSGVSLNGVFTKMEGMTGWTVDSTNGIPQGWTVKEYHDYSKDYLTFRARSNGTFKFSGSTTANTLQYSLDNGTTWNNLAHNTNTPTVQSGNTIMFKASNLTSLSNKGIGKFISTGMFDVEGNIMSLLYDDNFTGQTTLSSAYTFYNLFNGCTGLTSAENISLPATTLASYCYYGMFQGCTGLTAAPELPATTLANNCYYYMFRGCTSLTSAPVLPATTLAEWCYYGMFQGCTGLTAAPELPATTLASSCYYQMFSGCTSLTSAPELPATSLANNCYYGMFQGCTGLTAAPELPATTLANNCYYYMFYECTSLTSAPELPATTLATGCYQSMFNGCTSLTSAPELPVTTLTERCYYQMFQGCTGLTAAPELPATTLANNCYNYMFSQCTSLTSAPELPATTLANSCYYYMFQGCTGLTAAPELLATTLASYCYYGMFNGCTSLTSAPELPATTLATGCYQSMFNGCTSLTSAPELPVTTLTERCYQSMFYGCTSLVNAPELPATTLEPSCYNQMFQGCSSLSAVTCLATEIPVNTCTANWLSGVSQTGVFSKAREMKRWALDSPNGIPQGWTVKNYDSYAENYLTFTAKENGTFKFSGSTTANTLQYSLDNGATWNNLAHNTNTPTVQSDNTIMFKASGLEVQYNAGIGKFISSGEFEAEGNIMSLLYRDNFIEQYTLTDETVFYGLFNGCTGLTSAENLSLPATTLSNACYTYMFQDCTSLTTAPLLPATTLANGCYNGMFVRCTSLTTAPELPATALTVDCYSQMFGGCTSLTTAPALPATTLTENCYWLMFALCTSLTESPVLPATTLARTCYKEMFVGCSSLNYIKCFATNISARDCTRDWVQGVSPTGVFTKMEGMTGWTTGTNGIPQGWTVEEYHDYSKDYLTFTAKANGTFKFSGSTTANTLQYSLDNGATWNNLSHNTNTPTVESGNTIMFKASNLIPQTNKGVGRFISSGSFDVEGNVMSLLYNDDFEEQTTLSSAYTFYNLFNGCTGLTSAENLSLPASVLTNYCYYQMFYRCTSLISAPELPATTLANSCYYYMFNGCINLSTAPELPATTLADRCYYGMFQGCTSLETAPSILPVTVLVNQCYYQMFYGCTSLTSAPVLPATTLAEGCYISMFAECTSLVQAPELPATTLARYCYYYMFNGCIHLSAITCLATDISASDCTTNWLSNVSPTGVFKKAEGMTGWALDSPNGVPVGWTVKDYDPYAEEYLTFIAKENGTFRFSGSTTANTLQYSLDNGATWVALPHDTDTSIVSSGSSIMWKGNLIPQNYDGIGKFISSGSFDVEGNIMSLLYGDNFNEQTTLSSAYTFYRLFSGCIGLTSAENISLPATTLTESCYQSMFSGCTSLETAPVLPATSLYYSCYSRMFQGCNSLVTPPVLPSTSLANYCYSYMFFGCTSLTSAPELPATTLANYCYQYMFSYCTSLVNAPELPATTLANSCYQSMFDGCTSLTSAPALPATTLASNCYRQMFQGCSSLSAITCLATDISATDCTTNWLSGVSLNGVFTKNSVMNSWTKGPSGIPFSKLATWVINQEGNAYMYWDESGTETAKTITNITSGVSSGNLVIRTNETSIASTSSTVDWIHVTVTTGNVQYSVDANTTTSGRSGSVTIVGSNNSSIVLNIVQNAKAYFKWVSTNSDVYTNDNIDSGGVTNVQVVYETNYTSLTLSPTTPPAIFSGMPTIGNGKFIYSVGTFTTEGGNRSGTMYVQSNGVTVGTVILTQYGPSSHYFYLINGSDTAATTAETAYLSSAGTSGSVGISTDGDNAWVMNNVSYRISSGDDSWISVNSLTNTAVTFSVLSRPVECTQGSYRYGYIYLTRSGGPELRITVNQQASDVFVLNVNNANITSSAQSVSLPFTQRNLASTSLLSFNGYDSWVHDVRVNGSNIVFNVDEWNDTTQGRSTIIYIYYSNCQNPINTITVYQYAKPAPTDYLTFTDGTTANTINVDATATTCSVGYLSSYTSHTSGGTDVNSVTTGSTSSLVMTVTFNENTNPYSSVTRYAEIMAGGKQIQLTINQAKAAPYLWVDNVGTRELQINFGSSGGTIDVPVITNCNVVFSSSGGNITGINVTNQRVFATVMANTDTTAKSYSLNIQTVDLQQTIYARISGGISGVSVVYLYNSGTATGGSTTVNYQSHLNQSIDYRIFNNDSVTVSSTQPWITIGSTTGGSVEYNIDANQTQSARTGSIIINGNIGGQAVLTITQDPYIWPGRQIYYSCPYTFSGYIHNRTNEDCSYDIEAFIYNNGVQLGGQNISNGSVNPDETDEFGGYISVYVETLSTTDATTRQLYVSASAKGTSSGDRTVQGETGIVSGINFGEYGTPTYVADLSIPAGTERVDIYIGDMGFIIN